MKAVVLAVVGAMLFSPLAEGVEQVERSKIQAPREVSVAVVKHAAQKITIIHNKLKANEPVSATDYASLASALEAQFSNFEETGLTSSVAKWIVENRMTEAVLREPEFSQVPLDVREKFIEAFGEHGLPYIHQQIVKSLYAHAELAASRANGGHFARACCGPCRVPWLSIAGLYLTIVGLALTGPPGLILGLTYITAGMGGLALLTGC
jgi:hypothetical protein